ncbi:hypothetical protein Lmor_1409 [Legionella moravica]|uniref:Bacterial protein of uncharacterized function (DUF883) n=1 Tax=Legionella moravica TaxID=39962 RepID=A0A378K3M8_9GAMM|nr:MULTISPECIES: DUF883 C-terminal domain-containing protein [Legionella]KTD34876.1 hypothetical protein Lmor_1409 [Legionella moravica]RUR17995.1 hypothetical protein ELY21_09655 [Legionella sp. km535]STX63879.1 Bacterial protein of uncharacterised function (DUF883) [Legionella moravica]
MASTKSKVETKNQNPNSSHVAAAAEELLNEGKKFAHEVYHEGINKVSDAEEAVKEYSDKLVQKIQEKPLTSVLVAAGVGMLLAAFLRK